MWEKDLGIVFNDWLVLRKDMPCYSIEDFVLEKYLEIHQEEPGGTQEKEAAFRKRAKAWKTNGQKFEKFAKGYPDTPQLEQWQAAEMLDNVITEIAMGRAEKYCYLSNVKLLCCYRLVRLLDRESKEKFKALIEEQYDREWEQAKCGVTESEIQDMFAETVSMMQYAGIDYNDETRRILADIGVGRSVEFEDGSLGEAEQDICFLADFLVSEMVLSDTDEKYTEEEREEMAEQVVPVCVSSAFMIQNGSNPNHIMKLAQGYLGKLFSKKNLKLLAKICAVMVAAKVLVSLIKLALVGTIVHIGLVSLWNCCKVSLNLSTYKQYDSIQSLFSEKFMKKKMTQKQNESDGPYLEESERLIDEEEYENA